MSSVNIQLRKTDLVYFYDIASNSPSKESPSSQGTNHTKAGSGSMNSSKVVASASSDNYNTHALKNRESFRDFYVEHGLENQARKVINNRLVITSSIADVQY